MGDSPGDDQFGRVQENFRVLVGLQTSLHTPIVVAGQVATTSSTTSGSSRTGITIPPDEAVPYQDLPSDDADPVPRWLIRLGSVNWDATQRAGTAYSRWIWVCIRSSR